VSRSSRLTRWTHVFFTAGVRMLVHGRQLGAVGVDRVPDEGPVLLAVRHYHHLFDGVGLIRHVKRPVHILVALDWISNRPARRIMEALTSIAGWPVTLRTEELGAPGKGRRAYRQEEVPSYQGRSFRECAELLGDGRVVAIFPEGYPVIDPHSHRAPRATVLAPFKSGFARLAVAASRRSGRPVHVLPVGIRCDGTPSGRLVFVFGHGRDVTASTEVDALVAETYDDVLELSA
jgi:1-acyl-sn-glycerol-3-phosphate acyltransferase